MASPRHADALLVTGPVSRNMAVPLRRTFEPAGDVVARFQQRADEIVASLAILDTLLRTVAPGVTGGRPATDRTRSAPPYASGVGICEGWRGAIVHRIEIDRDHRVTRNKIVDPSFLNWPALPVALAGTIVPDFPLAKSFNLSYASNDL